MTDHRLPGLVGCCQRSRYFSRNVVDMRDGSWLDNYMEATETPITEATTEALAAMHAEATEIMGKALDARSRNGYQLARVAAEIIENEMNSRGLFAQENEDFEVIGWAA